MSDVAVSREWTPSSAEGRWAGFGPYYAMFPVPFARQQVGRFCRPGGTVLDPFCGRGTVPFVSQVTGRRALGTDINPVAWLYSSVKLHPAENPDDLLARVNQVLSEITPSDRVPANEFQSLAWHPGVLGFLNAARRSLRWMDDVIDRTLMGIILVHLHGKLGEGLSNQLRQSKSMSPDYATRWWRSREMLPPAIDIREFFRKKLAWRYARGIPEKKGLAEVRLGDARTILPTSVGFQADFILTSPPYCGVTNYEYDNWIRLWMLGGDSLPSYKAASRFQGKEAYKKLLAEVFFAARDKSSRDVTVYVRTDARQFTLEATIGALLAAWPDHRLDCRYDLAAGPTQTALFGNPWNKAGEVDLLLSRNASEPPIGFHSVKAGSSWTHLK